MREDLLRRTNGLKEPGRKRSGRNSLKSMHWCWNGKTLCSER